MRTKQIVFLVVLVPALCFCARTAAQTFSLSTGRERVVSLAGLWRFHTGDNPAWADPGFDDSKWPLVHSDKSWTEQGYPAFNGYAWYRFKVEVPGDGKPVGLLFAQVISGFKVYADGTLIGSGGSRDATWNPRFVNSPAVFEIPMRGSGRQTVTIALRVWTFKPIAVWFGAGSITNRNWMGDPDLLRTRQRWLVHDREYRYVNEYAYGVFTSLLGLAILALFLYRPSDREYLWFAILLLSNTVTATVHLWMNLGTMPFTTWRVIELTSNAGGLVAALLFFSIVLGQRRTVMLWIVSIPVAMSPFTTVLILREWTTMGVAYGITELCFVPAYCWIIWKLFAGAVKKDVSAQLLLLPVALSYGSNLIEVSQRIAWQLGFYSRPPRFGIQLFTQPFAVDSIAVIDYIFLLALLVFLVRRFSLARKEEERLAGEMEAARTIQSLLIPAEAPATPGFIVESIYLPAHEVGGDFFIVQPEGDGSLLVVIGDVSGKGLRAAMTVSAAIGALRGCTLRTPAAVLDYLNRILHGQVNGFVTCCAALLERDGTLTVANAGHLAPYRNGEELALENGLPLGITEDVTYGEQRFILSAKDRLTFISDGIVEARDEVGVLFGFERMREICREPALRIADAAQKFGQEDDITVLTVEPAAAAA